MFVCCPVEKRMSIYIVCGTQVCLIRHEAEVWAILYYSAIVPWDGAGSPAQAPNGVVNCQLSHVAKMSILKKGTKMHLFGVQALRSAARSSVSRCIHALFTCLNWPTVKALSCGPLTPNYLEHLNDFTCSGCFLALRYAWMEYLRKKGLKYLFVKVRWLFLVLLFTGRQFTGEILGL